jgi:hypothetical protein
MQSDSDIFLPIFFLSQIAALGTMAPSRQGDIARVAFRQVSRHFTFGLLAINKLLYNSEIHVLVRYDAMQEPLRGRLRCVLDMQFGCEANHICCYNLRS